jgi:curved DNA-binding protein CbpA
MKKLFKYHFSTGVKFNPSKDTCYYKILNVPSSATLEEIKKEYYRLAKKYHPDNVNENSKDNQSVSFV